MQNLRLEVSHQAFDSELECLLSKFPYVNLCVITPFVCLYMCLSNLRKLFVDSNGDNIEYLTLTK